MPSRGRAPAVQGRGAQAAALADALASQGRTRARMASLTAYGNGGRWRDPRAPGAGGAQEPSDHPGKLRGSVPGRVTGGSRLQRALLAWGWGRMLSGAGGFLEPGKGAFVKSVESKRLKFRSLRAWDPEGILLLQTTGGKGKRCWVLF